MTTDIEVSYYNSGWQDLTDYVTAFEVTEKGISGISEAVVNLESTRSNLNTLISSPYKLLRVQVTPGAAKYPIFMGYIDNAHLKTLAGTSTERSKLSLDCYSYSNRLSTDYITYNYYDAQSAMSPLADSNSYSYRDVMEAFLAYPDSARDGTGLEGTGFAVSAALGGALDGIIDATCNFDKQTLFEAVTLICDHIGYDGYFTVPSSQTFTPTINLFPFDKANTATITDPLIKEPEYVSGSRNDVANVIFMWGDIDAGVPSDGDRWTEYGYGKYDPSIWTANIYDENIDILGSGIIEDVDNTVINEYLRINGKCLKVYTTNSSAYNLRLDLNLTNTESSIIDAETRIRGLSFNLKILAQNAPAMVMPIRLWLTDDSGNIVKYNISKSNDYIVETGLAITGLTSDFEDNIYVEFTKDDIKSYGSVTPNVWMQHTGSSFDWGNITKLTIELFRNDTFVGEWGMYIDALQFIGGLHIQPFMSYSETLCPPVTDATSISNYGVHVAHIQDSSITSFELAAAEQNRILTNLKNPNPVLEFIKANPEATQLFPSNVINSAYRIIELKYKWNAKSKDCNTYYRCVGKTMPLPPIWTQHNELRLLVR